ncbi:hypothetical protein E4U54_004931 [Claviceps lovelessii]|nr:hypothetical protein E4U54_004931 [Claviceps lovelessii]
MTSSSESSHRHPHAGRPYQQSFFGSPSLPHHHELIAIVGRRRSAIIVNVNPAQQLATHAAKTANSGRSSRDTSAPPDKG